MASKTTKSPTTLKRTKTTATLTSPKSPQANPKTTNSSANSNRDKDNDNFLEEWKKARELLSFFDDKLHDLRKYGFSFLTVLLTAEAIIIPGTIEMPDKAKLGVFIITLLLVTTLHLIDKNYVSYQEAANTRATVLEKILNLELSEIISLRYRIEGVSKNVKWIYFLIIIGVLVLGYFSFKDITLFTSLLAIFAVAAVLYIKWQSLPSKFYHSYADDWIVTPLRCTKKEPVTVMVTNLNGKRRKKISKEDLKKYYEGKTDLEDGLIEPIIFKKGEKVLDIINQEDFTVKPVIAKVDIIFYVSYLMQLNWKDFGKKGLYKIRPKGRYIPYHHTITVTD